MLKKFNTFLYNKTGLKACFYFAPSAFAD